jgi:hypothetical protein
MGLVFIGQDDDQIVYHDKTHKHCWMSDEAGDKVADSAIEVKS